MSDRYSHWLPKLLAKLHKTKYFAITITEDTCLYSCAYAQVWLQFRVHEEKHKEQYRRYGRIGMWSTYLWQMLRKGYYERDLEKEAMGK